MKIVFMGTPDFAVASLKILVEHKYDIVGVITSTDKYGGRGGKVLMESAVKKYAVSQGLYVMQPKNLKAPEFNAELKALNADVQIVVAFRMLPEMVWNMPPMGTYNLHGSLLPKYRGAAPINWSVINGDTETGVTTFKLKHEIDTGAIALQKRLPIHLTDNVGDVHDRMMAVGATAVLETVQMIENETVVLTKQDDALKSKAPKIYTETCEINFDQETKKVYDFIRGLSPYPVAWTTLHGKKLKIYNAEIYQPEITDDETQITVKPVSDLSPGSVSSNGKNEILVDCNDGQLSIKELQLSGKKRMDVSSFLNGYNWLSNSQK